MIIIQEIVIDRIIRSRRKTVALEITPDAKLVVRAGLRTRESCIEHLVETKRRWITRKIADVAARPRPFPKNFIEGETFAYLGKAYPLAIVDDADGPLSLADCFILPRRHIPIARQMFVEWYTRQAHRIIAERLGVFEPLSGIRHAGHRITGARTRWGSCTARNSLNFSWRLIMAPLEVVDYVIAHELAHVDHKDHSRRFWEKVEELFPRYADCERWMKTNGHSLGL